MALSGIFIRIPHIRRPSRCHVGVGFFSLVVLLGVFFIIINYNFSSLWPLEGQFTGRSAIQYDRLQPLREMFLDASQVKDTGHGSNPVVMALKASTSSMLNVSDLQENGNKVSVLLLLIVTTAPSRHERREAIRETWWKKCDGIEVSESSY